MLRRFLLRPDYIFLLCALTFGLTFFALTPPMGGGNETHNFQRAVSIAYGHLLVEAADVPAGFVQFIDEGNRFFFEGLKPPYGYSREEYEAVARISQQADHPIRMPSSISPHHPFAYAPQALMMWLGAVGGASPLMVFYIARLAGLLAAIGLTFAAIRLMPSHRWGMCVLALLPPLVFSRSTIDADQVTIALGFLCTAATLREITETGKISGNRLSLLAALFFVMAQCKVVYCLLSFMALAIPGNRFSSVSSRLRWLAAIILPGIAGSVVWLVLVKHTYFSGATYHTWAGEVNPDAQLAFILHHPLEYAAIFFRTLFTTDFFPMAILGLLGIFGPPVSIALPVYFLLIGLLFTVQAADRTGADIVYPAVLKSLVVGILLAFLCLMPTLLYLQWTGLQSPVIKGFQGRYLYPLLPMLLVFSSPLDKPLPIPAGLWTLALGCTGFVAMLVTMAATY